MLRRWVRTCSREVGQQPHFDKGVQGGYLVKQTRCIIQGSGGRQWATAGQSAIRCQRSGLPVIHHRSVKLRLLLAIGSAAPCCIACLLPAAA